MFKLSEWIEFILFLTNFPLSLIKFLTKNILLQPSIYNNNQCQTFLTQINTKPKTHQ